MMPLVGRSLRRIWILLSVLAVLLVTFQIAIVAIAGSLDADAGFDRIAGLVPAFVVQAFGPALASFAGMTTIGFFEPLIVMLVVQFAIYVATEPAGDVETGLVDLVLARPLPRHRLMTRSLVVTTGAAILLPAIMAGSLWASLWWLAPDRQRWPEARVIVQLTAYLAAEACVFGAAALAAAAWTRRRGAAQAFVGVAAVTLYLIDFVGDAWSRASWISLVSPFHLFHGASILTGRADPLRDLTVLAAMAGALTAAAYWQFQRRDV